jgi:hypothetical protein
MIETIILTIAMIIWFFFGTLAYIEFMETNKWELPTLFEYILSLILIPLGLIGVCAYLTARNN